MKYLAFVALQLVAFASLFDAQYVGIQPLKMPIQLMLDFEHNQIDTNSSFNVLPKEIVSDIALKLLDLKPVLLVQQYIPPSRTELGANKKFLFAADCDTTVGDIRKQALMLGLTSSNIVFNKYVYLEDDEKVFAYVDNAAYRQDHPFVFHDHPLATHPECITFELISGTATVKIKLELPNGAGSKLIRMRTGQTLENLWYTIERRFRYDRRLYNLEDFEYPGKHMTFLSYYHTWCFAETHHMKLVEIPK